MFWNKYIQDGYERIGSFTAEYLIEKYMELLGENKGTILEGKMPNYVKYYYYKIYAVILSKKINMYGESQYYSKKRKYVNRIVYPVNEIHAIIADLISCGQPFMMGRFGANELHAINVVDNNLRKKQIVSLNHMCNDAGFFPKDLIHMKNFVQLMKEYSCAVDCLGVWNLPYEPHIIKKYMNNKIFLCGLRVLEPWWDNVNKPWTRVLEGKKVLVIHPFEYTIQAQYKKRELLFKNKDILPQFELKTLKAVQTIAGEKDSRFATWFDALDYMYGEAMNIDFDIAIIGCGAYGFPLSAKLKQAGKQVIHLGGVTQILFGIKGKRWDNDDRNPIVKELYNEYWVYPSEEDKPKNANKVEDGCYW